MTNSPRHWFYANDKIKEPFHYKGCGLDDIYLTSGYEITTIDGETSVSIKNLDGLLKAIAWHLVDRKKNLEGKEIRFLRKQMDLTQSELGRFIGYDAQTIARYEKGQSEIPGPADRLLRVLYRDHARGEATGVSIRDVLKALDELDARMTDKQLFEETPEGWKAAA